MEEKKMKKITESEQIPEFQESIKNIPEHTKQKVDARLKAITDTCTLTDFELVQACEKWIDRLCKSGGDAWTLEVPVNMNRDPDMLFTELIRRFSKHFKITDVLRDRSPKPAGAVWVKYALQQSKEAIEFAFKELECPKHFVETWGNLYMNVLHAIDQALDESGPSDNKEGETDHLIRQHAIAFMNWTLSGECDTYNCTDEDQWTNIYTQEVISAEQLHQLWQQSKSK